MKEITAELLKRYLQGECSREEEQQVDEWYLSFEENENDSRLLNVGEREELRKKMFLKIKLNLLEKGESIEIEESVERERPVSSNKLIYLVAAGVVLLILFGVGALFFRPDNKSTIAEVESNLVEIVNSSNTIVRRELEDGTVIWLHPQSKIQLAPSFSRNNRNVTLKGEAFFEVAKDHNHPFSISTGRITTRVLGTSFNISAYTSENIQVSVMTGKVMVELANGNNGKQTSQVILTPQQRASYVKTENKLAKEEPKHLPELNMWKTTDIKFDNESLAGVLKELNKRFGVNIKAKNEKLLNCLIVADFTNQNLPDILELLSKSVEATYVLEENSIIFYGEGCLK
jgi:transmembrane sensor